MNGIIVINKPGGITSHQVVHSIRKIFRGVKAGHSGTLDPMATGVLPVCLGRATRVVEYIIELPKTYRAAIVLGKTTDTEDATGKIIAEKAVPPLEQIEVENIIHGFIGTIEQLPPRYSAVKYHGKPLYYWTRQGKDVPRRVRSAEIYTIELLEYNCDSEPHLVLDVQCSRGTYIRTLAADIGKIIGCGAHLSSLIRYAVGPYKLEHSFTLEEIAEMALRGCLDEYILNMDTALVNLSKVVLNNVQIEALRHGQIVTLEQQDFFDHIKEEYLVSIYDQQGNFKAIACREEVDGSAALRTVKYLSD